MSILHFRNTQDRDHSTSVDAIKSASLGELVVGHLDAEQRAMLDVLGRTFFLLALGALAIVTVSGDFPWFLLPLGLFLFFGCCLSWRQRQPGHPSHR